MKIAVKKRENVDLKLAVIVPDRGDRPAFLKNCLRLIGFQTRQPDRIILINYPPLSNEFDLVARIKQGYEDASDCDVVCIMENDDWYSQNYLREMERHYILAGCPNIFGIQERIYYHIHKREYRVLNERTPALMNTMIKTGLKVEWNEKVRTGLDVYLWKQLKGTSIVTPEILSIGIKHGIGLCGGIGHGKKFKYDKADSNLQFLKQTVDRQSFQFYKSLIKESSTLVTVLINTYNENPIWLRQTIDSYLSNKISKQIIVCTLAGDKNLSILKGYGNQIEIYLCPGAEHPGKSPQGAFYQINSALNNCDIKGDWFCFMSSNDIVNSNRLELEVEQCIKNNKLICYSDFDEFEETTGHRKTRTFFPYDYKKHLRGNFVSDASLIKTSLLLEYAPFNYQVLGNYSFWDLWLRIYEGEGDVFTYLQQHTWSYRLNPDSMHLQRRSDTKGQQQGREWYNRMLDFNNRRASL